MRPSHAKDKGDERVEPRWAARLDGVREVSLAGDASLAFWKERLAPLGLGPLEREGRAEVFIIGAAARFWGLSFREMSFAVSVVPRARTSRMPPELSASYLLAAVHSRRLLAWCERTLFSTPYHCGQLELSALLPAALRWSDGDEVAFRAEMAQAPGGPDRSPSREGEEGWSGAVYLPTDPAQPALERERGAPRRLFIARIQGLTRAYPFLPGHDALTLQPSPARPVLGLLQESGFVAREWILRESASHAKSWTMHVPT